MNISSYNVTDVAYHYLGLRVLNQLGASATREEQVAAISRSVFKYVNDRSLRLMLPEPKSTFESVGKKVCQELVHLGLAHSQERRYALTEVGAMALGLLDQRQHVNLRRLMAAAHLKVYDNLRAVVEKHVEIDGVWRPIVDGARIHKRGYIEALLKPSIGAAVETVAALLDSVEPLTPKKLEGMLRETVLRNILPQVPVSEPIFRSMCDRLVSLRLLNMRRRTSDGADFEVSYPVCVAQMARKDWYFRLAVPLPSGDTYVVHLPEPDMKDSHVQAVLLESLEQAFQGLAPEAGYFDVPEVRDLVCASLRIPEAAFDEGVNQLLDLKPAPLTVGLRYERISGRRKPIARRQGPESHIFNLIRRI